MSLHSEYLENDIPNSNQIDKIAVCLAARFLKPLFLSSIERNYFFYVQCLIEILGWSHEFYSEYFDSGAEPNECDEFLISWGNRRLEQYFAENSLELKCFPGRAEFLK